MLKIIDTDDESKIQKILAEVKTDNKRYSDQQFQKFCKTSCRWIVLYDDPEDLDQIIEPKAMLAYKKGQHDVDGTYVCELQAFESGKGYGKELLERTLDLHPDLWLFADWTCGEKLLEYYRQFKRLHELEFFTSDGAGFHIFYGDVKSALFQTVMSDMAGMQSCDCDDAKSK